jgi:hypothetical protein
MKFLEAVTVCVNYADILRVTIPFNKSLIDNWVIVTSTQDKETFDVCKYYGVTCIMTDKFFDNGAPFNKAKGINEGLKKLTQIDWMLHLDADIILPANFRQICKDDQLQKDAIYGIDRINVIGDEELFRLFITKNSQIKQWTYLNQKTEYEPAFRLHNLNSGYNVIGFFQLWHSNYLKNNLKYPENHTSAARTDVGFQQQWNLDKRLLYPGIIGYHIMTEALPKGYDWNGRKSKKVGQDFLLNNDYVPDYPDWHYKGLPNPKEEEYEV